MTTRRSRVPDDLKNEPQMRAMHDRHDRIHLTIGDLADGSSGLDPTSVTSASLTLALDTAFDLINEILAAHRLK